MATRINALEHAAGPPDYWGSRGRRFKSCQPDAGQRAYPIDGYALSWSPGDYLGDYVSAGLPGPKMRSMATAPLSSTGRSWCR
jgi:hypothetical protein